MTALSHKNITIGLLAVGIIGSISYAGVQYAMCSHAPRAANIVIHGEIKGKPFFLFASSRLQNGIQSAIIVRHDPSLINLSMIQKGPYAVLVNFSYAIRHNYFVHGEAMIPANQKHGVKLPLSNSKDRLKIMVLEHG
ncbi:MAG: hypothetical protein M0003_10330 [Acidithiobacillus sp.]|nr:hypothetical protein [Acidithiobacillus sp.]